MLQGMVRVLTLAARMPRAHRRLDMLRATIVTGCALALVLAKAPLPF